MAFEKVFASFLLSIAPFIKVSAFAEITLTGVLNSCDKFEIKSLLIEAFALNSVTSLITRMISFVVFDLFMEPSNHLGFELSP